MTMATVYRDEDGQLVLHDPQAMDVITAVAKHNCRNTAELQRDRIQHFAQRIIELGHSSETVVITIINVDDKRGGPVADVLMPGHNWQDYRNHGEIPFARGIATRAGMETILVLFDRDALDKLIATQGVAVVVIDHNVANVYLVEDFL